MQRINADSLPAKDLLNRQSFAEQIATSLKLSFVNGEDSFVLGINGKWGSGKTTLMYYLKDSLKEALSRDKRNVFFDFNPWMFSRKDDLLSLFLNELAKALSIKKLRQKISSFADAMSYLDWVKYVNSTAGGIQQFAKSNLKKLGAKSSILELKKDIDTAIIENKLRIFVFIDDLDRLTPNEVVEIFQIIKLNASFKNTVFVIAYDKEVVQDILALHHGFNGEKYIEKIVQVDYRIPDPLDEVLQEIFFATLNTFLNDVEIRYDEVEFQTIWIVRRLRYYFLTLRDVYRYFNALKLRLPAIKQDVDIYQFCVIEAIRVFDYNAYELIQKNYKKALMFGPKEDSYRIGENISNENTHVLYNYLFVQAPDHKPLFPISDPQYFDRYFALSVGKVDVREETVDRFVKDADARLYILQNAEADGSIGALLSRLKTRKIDLSAVNPIIRWKTETEGIFINCIKEFIGLLGHIINSHPDFAKGTNYLMSIMPGDDGSFNPARFYLVYYFNSIVFEDKEGPFFKHLDVIENHKPALKKMEVDFLNRYQNDHLVFQRPHSRTDFFHKLFLARYREAFPEEYVTKLKSYLETPANIFLFLRLIIQPEKSRMETLDLYWLKKLVDATVLQALESKCEGMVSTGLAGTDKAVFDLFFELMEDIRQNVSQGR